MVHGIRSDELVRLTPRLKSYLRRPNPTWPEIIDAADWLRHDLDISKPLWGDARLTMGQDLAAVALAIVEPGTFPDDATGLLSRDGAKAKAGELHLERTVWALRRATLPIQAPRSGQGRGAAAMISDWRPRWQPGRDFGERRQEELSMVRFWRILAAVVAVSTAGGPAHAKVAIYVRVKQCNNNGVV
jgi:hypothetical protein